MDAVSHRETATQIRLFRRGKDAAVGNPVAAPRAAAVGQPKLPGVKAQAMDIIKSVETVAQVGAMKLTGGVALYAAHIRQMDQGAARQRQQQRVLAREPVERLGRE